MVFTFPHTLQYCLLVGKWMLARRTDSNFSKLDSCKVSWHGVFNIFTDWTALDLCPISSLVLSQKHYIIKYYIWYVSSVLKVEQAKTHGNYYLPPTKLREGKVFSRVCSGGSLVIITHDTLDITIQVESSPPPRTWPNLFIMKRVGLASGQFASYCNAFFCMISLISSWIGVFSCK